MKRSNLLVDYPSSGEDDDGPETALPPPPPPKKRKLPSLAPGLTLPVPKDNPALHQGRIRSSPHVEGQFATYVYVPLRVTRGSPLDTLLSKIITRAKQAVPSLHEISAFQSPTDTEREFHISLTRPVYLRAHQREEFKTAVRAVCRSHSSFAASFTTFAELTNDERTRTFLTIELGAGHRELEKLCDALTPILRTYRQKEFYDSPRFHISIAWALLAPPPPADASCPSDTVVARPTASEAEGVPETPTPLTENTPQSEGSAQFPTIPQFPATMVSSLEEVFGASLRSKNVGAFEADCLGVKVGKDVHRWKLSMQA